MTLQNHPILYWLKNILGIYTLAIGFNDILEMPYFVKKVQLPEIIAVIFLFPLFSIFIVKTKITKYFNQFNIVDISLIIYVSTLLFSDLIGKHHHSIPTLLGFLYLFSLFAMTKIVTFEALTEGGDFIKKIEKYFIILGTLQAIIGIIGCLFWYIGHIDNIAIQQRATYMYFGEVARAQALTGDPNMLAAILSISIIFISNKILQYKYNQMLLIALFCCCLGLIFTMSKSFLLTLGIVLILINYTHVSTAFFLRRKKYLLNIISITLISLFLLITHFYITPIHTNPLLVNKGGSFINEKPLLSNDKWAIYETSYSINKKVSYHLFQTHFFWGVGVGKQVTFCDELKEKSLYPKSFGCLDPHCSYTGAFAEAGIFGGLSYLFFIFSLLYSINIMLNNKNLKNNFVYYGLFAAILFATVEALTLENNTFRHHWLCFGILSGLFSYYKNKLCLNTTKSVS